MDKIVEQALNNDPHAIEQLMAYYTPLFKSIANKYSKYNKAHYEDILQDCRLTFIQLLKSYDPEKSPLGYYIKSNLTKRISADKYFFPETSMADLSGLDIVDDIDIFSRIDMQNAIATGVELLPMNQKLAIKLYYYMDMGQEECAEYLGIKQPAFSRLLKRAENNLGNFMKKM